MNDAVENFLNGELLRVSPVAQLTKVPEIGILVHTELTGQLHVGTALKNAP